MPAGATQAPILIPLPQGLGVNGVVVWALRLAEAFARRGWPVGLVRHGEPAGVASANHDVPHGVRVFDARELAQLSAPGCSLHAHVALYRQALGAMGWSAGQPAILLPNLEPQTFAIAAALACSQGDRLRVVGWQHSDTPFDASMLAYYEPVLGAMVGVSTHLADQLRQRFTWRAEDVAHVPYGVPGAAALAPRQPGPLRLLYAGRFEHEQKRIRVVLHVARLLHEAEIAHTLRLVGDGPAAAEVALAARKLPAVECLPPASKEQMAEHFAWADVLLLASRYEGLSIAMLEAMAAGVVPFVARVRSGALDAIDNGVTGMLIHATEHEPEVTIAERFRDAVIDLAEQPDRLSRMRSAAHHRACERFGMDAHADACEALFHRVLEQPGRWWPLDRPCRMDHALASADARAMGTVPHDAAERMVRLLAREPGPLVLYGAGRHTRALADVLAGAPVSCIVDDDTRLHGSRLWGWPIVGLDRLDPNATVVVSSYLHQQTMAERARACGARVLTLYNAGNRSEPSHASPQRGPDLRRADSALTR